MSTTQRPTPETDAQCYDCEYQGDMGGKFTASAGKLRADGDHVPADFARKLERERDEARERAESKHGLWMAELSRVTGLEKQLEAMREAIKEACEALKAISRSTDYAGDHGSAMVATKDAITAKTALAKLQPYIKP